jgi:hypothetical protein
MRRHVELAPTPADHPRYVSIVGAALVMEASLLSHDFSVRYVAQVGSLSTPTHITFNG